MTDTVADPYPESMCHRCGGPNRPWSAPSPLWNEVMRGGSINGDEIYHGIVCPTCFMVLAEEKGVADLWHLHPRRVHVDLEIVTPSGRVWDDKTWMWVEPSELCDWWPERDGAAVAGEGGCGSAATVSVGATENWHLCGSCAVLPRFKRMKRRDLKKAGV